MKQIIRFVIAIVLPILLVACAESESQIFIEIGSNVDLSLPTGMATDSKRNLYVFDSGNHRVIKFSQNGTLLTEWGHQGIGAGEFNCLEDKGTICGIAIDQQDNVFVVDKGNYRIQKFDSEGNFITAWGGKGKLDGQFVRPIYVAVDADGNVFVTDDRNPVVQKFDNNGQFLTKWGSLGSGDEQFSHATGIAVDSEGNVYIADYDNRFIQKFDNNGKFLLKWETGDGSRSGIPEAIAVGSDDRIYVTDSKLKQIEVFDKNGQSIVVLKLEGTGLFNRISPYGIAMDLAENVYISDRVNDRILKYENPLR